MPLVSLEQRDCIRDLPLGEVGTRVGYDRNKWLVDCSRYGVDFTRRVFLSRVKLFLLRHRLACTGQRCRKSAQQCFLDEWLHADVICELISWS